VCSVVTCGKLSLVNPLVIGVDASTTAVKVIAWDLAGNAVAQARHELALSMPRAGWHEQDARDWWTALVAGLREVTGQVDVRRLAGLSIAHQRETFVPLDAEGTPLRPALLWLDERCSDLLPELEPRLGWEAYHALTGRPLSANLAAGKLIWLARHEPEVFAAARWYADVQGYLVQRLTGNLATGWGSADPLGLFDIQAQQWAAPVLAATGITAAQLPALHPPAAVLGRLTPEAAGLTDLPAGLPVICGLGDGQAAGLAARVTGPGTAYLNLGTAVVSGTYAAAYTADRAFRTTCGGIPGTFILETVLLGGTYTVDWFLEAFAQPAPGEADGDVLARLEAEAAGLGPGAGGLVLVPYWNGALNPYWDASASGIVAGWRGIHRPHHLYRAILEGIAFEQRLHAEGVEAATGQPVAEYVVMGGGSRSSLWRQILADVTGKPIRRCAAPEASALGAGILAAAGAGLFADVSAAAMAMAHLEPSAAQPDPHRAAHYTQLYEEVYRPLYPALQGPLARLHALTR